MTPTSLQNTTEVCRVNLHFWSSHSLLCLGHRDGHGRAGELKCFFFFFLSFPFPLETFLLLSFHDLFAQEFAVFGKELLASPTKAAWSQLQFSARKLPKNIIATPSLEIQTPEIPASNHKPKTQEYLGILPMGRSKSRGSTNNQRDGANSRVVRLLWKPKME